MAAILLTKINILDNPSPFQADLGFEIFFEVQQVLRETVDISVKYVADAEDDTQDILLESLSLGPLRVGNNKVKFYVEAPPLEKIPAKDLLGVTVVLLTASYREREFIRVGYFVHNEYDNQEMNDQPPDPPVPERLCRKLLSDQPRVTRIPIIWDDARIDQTVAELGAPSAHPFLFCPPPVSDGIEPEDDIVKDDEDYADDGAEEEDEDDGKTNDDGDIDL